MTLNTERGQERGAGLTQVLVGRLGGTITLAETEIRVQVCWKEESACNLGYVGFKVSGRYK